MKITIAAFFAYCLLTFSALAQQPVWIQIEAQSSVGSARDRIAVYERQLDDVAGFYLGGGWYGIVVGPYVRREAETLLRQLKANRSVPRDSFIALPSSFREQYWPIGTAAPTQAQPLPDAEDAAVDGVAVAPVDPATLPDETKSQARASEALLDRDARKDLQVALKWAGFYTAAIDGAYGRGTRAAMSSWQQANNHEVTGVLTSGQRVELLAAYNAVLDGMDMRLVRDDASGIQMQIPTGVVAFAEYEPPFARFDAKGDLQAQVLLISQPGNQDRLFGLYEILQTLAIVPKDGPRTRRDSSFEIEGSDSTRHTYITARLSNGVIKGFALVWPAGNEERRSRVLDLMTQSYTPIDGVLDPALAKVDEDQAIDLIAGLAIRKPKLSRTGFYIDAAGTVLTTADAVGSCDYLTIDTEHDAIVIHTDTDLGIAVLSPNTPLAPIGVAAFQTSIPRLQSEIAVAGYPYGGVLVTPSLTFGKLADIRGLNGEDTVKRLSLTAQPGDVGGPVFDNGGAVLGMLLPRAPQNGQVLPDDVNFAVDSGEILTSLQSAGIIVDTTDTVAFMAPETLTLRAADQTVLVSCW